MEAMDDGNGYIVVLNGTGGAGKSTLAQALQASAPRPFIHLGIDAFLTGLPRQYVGFGPRSGEGLRFRADSDGRVTMLEAGPVMHRLIKGMHRAVAAMAASGCSVIVDHVLWEQEWLADCALVLPTALFVGVRCSREMVQERTRKRGDRPPGYELFAFDAVHAERPYDVEVDTTDQDITRCVAQILGRSARPAEGLMALRASSIAARHQSAAVELASVSWSWRAAW